MSEFADIRLRPSSPADEPFLFAVYASTRAEELAVTGWPEQVKTAFCHQQSTAQHAHYRQHYPGTEYLIIEHGGTPAGRLYIDRCPDEIRIIDIALLPAHRGHGIGTHLLTEIIAEGKASQRPVTIHVERRNPALRLYERLGFLIKDDQGIYLFMARPPDDPT